MAEAPNACEKNYLLELAQYLDEQGFQSDAEMVNRYVADPRERAGWRNADELVSDLAKDVWWHYGHVGDEDERYIYEEAEQTINDYGTRIHRCRKGVWSGARRRR